MPSRFTALTALAIGLVGCASDDLETDGPDTDGPDTDISASAVVDTSQFELPDLSVADRATVLGAYDFVDPTGMVPRGLLEDALVYFDFNRPLILQQQFITIVDLSQYAGNKRLWIVDMTTGAVEAHKVAHGAGSDPNADGFATAFGNKGGSHMSSLGYFLTGEIYNGTHPHSMRIDGLTPDGSPNGMANTNVRARAVVVHEASYVNDASGRAGRSDGCFALDPAIEHDVVNRIHGGSLIYAAKSPLHPPVGRTCHQVPAAGGTIDDRDACFVGGGPVAYLRRVTSAGVNDTLVWTKTTALTHETSFGTWSLAFAEAGRYHVEVYTDAAFAQSKQARYVVHAGAADHAVTLDQTAVDGYQSLGDFDFAAGGSQSMHLGDNTGEHVQLVFDAVRLTRIGAP